MSSFPRRPLACLLALWGASLAAPLAAQPHSQTGVPTSVQTGVPTDADPAATQATPAPPPAKLPAVRIAADPLATRSEDLAAPVNVLEDEDLVERRGATLGETLADQPGISASHFSAGASRPIIRGLDAARVKVLSDGAEIQDASTMSPDHAVSLEPMLTRRIEILRGPAALLYGGGAIGGVVNTLDRKIPEALPTRAVEGSVELRGETAARAAAGAVELTTGTGPFAVHVEGVKRRSGDYRTGAGWPDGERVPGSFNNTETGSLGLSWIGSRGFLGVAFTRQASRYGLPGHSHDLAGCHLHGDALHCGAHDEDDGHDHDHDHGAHGVPFVRLRSDRWDVRGELRDPLPGFTRLRLRGGLTDYRHDEIEGETVATTFRNKAHDARVELEHRPLGALRGVVGVQHTRRDFSALGLEAYVQPTRTAQDAVFLLEEYRLGAVRLELGLRHEIQQVRVDSAAPDRRHHGSSVSLAGTWQFVPDHALGLSWSRSVRLPSAEELYADGLHMATRTYERGNPRLAPEIANNLALSLRRLHGTTTYSVSIFHNRFQNFIHARTLDELDGLRLIEYSQQDASFVGIEAQLRQRLSRRLDLTLFADAVRGRLDGGTGSRDLPRMPAQRIGARLDGRHAGWEGGIEWLHVAAQHRVADHESSTPGYHLVNLRAARPMRIGDTVVTPYARLNNVGNVLAYNHASFIKDAAPLLGRNLVVGVRASF